jgi:hypothetical protein
LKIKKTMAYGGGNTGPNLEQCGGVKQVNGTPTPSDNWISYDTDISKQYKTAQLRFHT